MSDSFALHFVKDPFEPGMIRIDQLAERTLLLAENVLKELNGDRSEKTNPDTKENLNQAWVYQVTHHLSNTVSNLAPTIVPIAMEVYSLARPALALAADVAVATATPFSTGLWPLITMLHDFAMPVGVGVSIWGLIEWMLDNPKGKDRVKNSIMAYIGVFIIPYLFKKIQEAFMGLKW